MLFNLLFKINWRDLLDNKKRVLLQNNERENRSRKDHEWRVGEQVLINRDILQRKFLPKSNGPYTITKVYSNGLVQVQKGIVLQKLSIQRLIPYNYY